LRTIVVLSTPFEFDHGLCSILFGKTTQRMGVLLGSAAVIHFVVLKGADGAVDVF
jgi:hypothetical protein